MEKHLTIDSYIQAFPKEVQDILQTIRTIIKEIAPTATEAISYGMPTFKLKSKNLIHFAGYAHHIGVYPTPTGIDAFKKELVPYTTSKGAVQFPLLKPIPYELIKKITLFRVSEMGKKEESLH